MLGRYDMSNFSVWTSSEVQDEITRFGNEVTATNGSVNANRNALIAAGTQGQQLWNDWQIFLRDWQAYQTERARVGPAMFGTSSTSAIVNLRNLVNRYNPLDERLRTIVGSRPTTSEDTRSGSWWSQVTSNSGTQGLALVTALGIGAVGLVAVAVILSQARNIMRPVTGNRRRSKRGRR